MTAHARGGSAIRGRGYAVAMDDERQQLADNELAFREINERVEGRVDRWDGLEHGLHRVICECSDTRCVERIAISPADQRAVRDQRGRFVVAPGHDDARVERVDERHERYWVVEKHGDLIHD